MERTFLSVGAKYTETEIQKAALDNAIKKIEWFDLPAKKLPFSQGEALREMIKEMGNNPSKVGYGGLTCGAYYYSLLAMTNNYKEGEVKQATVYMLDTGIEAISLAVDTESR